MRHISRMILENPTSPSPGHDINDKQSTGKEKKLGKFKEFIR